MLYAFCVEACCRQEPLKNGGVGLNIEKAVGSGDSTGGLGAPYCFLKSAAVGLPMSFFFHFGTFRLSMWHFISACAMTRRKPNDSGSKSIPYPSINGLNICEPTTSFVVSANTSRLVFFF